MPKYDSPPLIYSPLTETRHDARRETIVHSELEHRNGTWGKIGGGGNWPSVADDGGPHLKGPSATHNTFYAGDEARRTLCYEHRNTTDRQEIIRRIKSEQDHSRRSHSPLEEQQKRRTSHLPDHAPTANMLQSMPGDGSANLGLGLGMGTSDTHVISSAAYAREWDDESESRSSLGLDISRPKSALHSGDFREEHRQQNKQLQQQQQQQQPEVPWYYNEHKQVQDQSQGHHHLGKHFSDAFSTSPVVPWHRDFPAAALRQARQGVQSTPPSARPRAVSHASLSSSFTYQPPTSPLVYQANAADIPDAASMAHRRRLRSPDRDRRHTYSPRLLQTSRSSLEYPPRSPFSAQPPSLRREGTFPYQAHQPRRSVTAFSSLPQTPYLAPRRPSVSDVSTLASPMVGSFEESILRGRMSTAPSKPLNFVAQIGVLGKGECKASLRCPPHVTVPFPAVFYSYSNGHVVDPEPSPYVGLVDLENNLQPPQRRHSSLRHYKGTHGTSSAHENDDDHTHDTPTRHRKQEKRKRRTNSPREPPGGSYRIPQQGQLQIVLKNPNKTAVKLFLIPYDLSDMEAGQKTFIRQRSYSAGPIIGMPESSCKKLSANVSETSLETNHHSDRRERPVLRYLVHCCICCPAKGRFFLEKNIRVVFANRVPDGKEKLRTEVQMPEPRYSAWKPAMVATKDTGPPVADRQDRRYSTGLYTSGSSTDAGSQYNALSTSFGSSSTPGVVHDGANISQGQRGLFVRSIDYSAQRLQRLPTLESRPASRGLSEQMDIKPPTSPTSPLSSNVGRHVHPKLIFERETSRDRGVGAAVGMQSQPLESLLSKRLRDLEMRQIDDSAERQS